MLVGKAAEHGSGTVTVRVRAAPGGLAIEVGDEGTGVAGDPERVFARRAGGVDGHGSGLALAHDRLTRLLVSARLLAPDGEDPPPGPRAALASACGYAHWEGVIAGFTEARRLVQEAWAEVFGAEMETTA